MSALLELAKYGQSYWLDDLSRRMIEKRRAEAARQEGRARRRHGQSRDFQRRTDEQRRLRCSRFARMRDSTQSYLRDLIVADVRDACDILLPVYDRTEGRDGFVSLEVSPAPRRDAPGSIVEARRLWKAVDRPNLFIKIPGTPEGVPASRDAADRRDQYQCDVALLHRELRGGCSRLRAGARATQGAARTGRSTGISRELLPESHRHAGRREASGAGQAGRCCREKPDRQMCQSPMRNSPTSALRKRSLDPLEGTRTRRRSTAATSVGEYQYQESGVR